MWGAGIVKRIVDRGRAWLVGALERDEARLHRLAREERRAASGERRVPSCCPAHDEAARAAGYRVDDPPT